jgi:carbon storage regulator CsrA
MSEKFERKSYSGGLVLTIKEGGNVVINSGELVIELVSIRGKQARLSFKANEEIKILRGELFAKLKGSR